MRNAHIFWEFSHLNFALSLVYIIVIQKRRAALFLKVLVLVIYENWKWLINLGKYLWFCQIKSIRLDFANFMCRLKVALKRYKITKKWSNLLTIIWFLLVTIKHDTPTKHHISRRPKKIICYHTIPKRNSLLIKKVQPCDCIF